MVDLTAALLPVRIVQAVFAIVVLGTLGNCRHLSSLSPLFPLPLSYTHSPQPHDVEQQRTPRHAQKLTFALPPAASDWDSFFFDGTPSQVAFLIFCACWTLLAVAYFIAAPLVVPGAAHHLAILALEAVTMIFWFAGFIALAAALGNGCPARYNACRTAAAGDAFSAFEW
jgi:hypothetical protein